MAKECAVPGVICKRGWLDDSDTDREMEVASQVYTRDVERMYEAKKSKTMAALHDVERIESIKKARVRTRHFQIHSVFHTCFPVQPHGRAGGIFRELLLSSE